MKALYSKALTAAAFCVLASPAAAITYECELKMSKSGGNWMGPIMYVKYDEVRGTATVIDGVINHYYGKPLEVSKIVENDKRVTFSYSTRKFSGKADPALGTTYANRIYRLTILKPSLKAKVHMKPVGYSNTWRDSGMCKTTK